MGRKPKPLHQRSNLFSFRYNLDDPEKYAIMEKFLTIANREQNTFMDLIAEAIKEYVENHWKGNYQTLLNSYEPGGVKSEGQLEQGIILELTQRNQRGFDINYQHIMDLVKERMGKRGGEAVAIAERVMEKLMENGVKIWM